MYAIRSYYDTAMDCVRTSIRLGSTDVTCAYRRTRKEMPAQDIEVTEALEEGVNFKFLSAPVSLEQQEDGKIKLTLIDMELGMVGKKTLFPVFAGCSYNFV